MELSYGYPRVAIKSFNTSPFRAIYGGILSMELQVTKLIPTKYINLMIYGDPTGLSFNEVSKFNNWLTTNRLLFNYVISDYPMFSEYSDIDNKPCEVYEVNFIEYVRGLNQYGY